MMKTIQIKPEKNEVPKVVDYIRSVFSQKKIPKKESVRSLLLAEDVLVKMVENAKSDIAVSVGGFLGNVEIRMKSKGDPFDSADIENLLFDGKADTDEEVNAVIRRLVGKLYGDNFSVRNENGFNKVTIRAKKSQFKQLAITMFALFAGVGAGLLMQYFLPASASNAVSNNIFAPIYTLFMNALKMIVAPLVFFSIASSIADFSDLKSLGRIAMKIVGLYLLTSMLAICVGFVTYKIFPIGNPILASSVTDAASATIAKGNAVKISIKDTIVGIIPSDVITPFQKANMLQIIFMAVILGSSASVLSKKFPAIKNGLVALNAVFSKITSVIVGFIPIIVFCSMAKMMVSMKFENLLDVFVWVPVIYFGDILLLCVYIILLVVFAHLNPLKFLSKYYPAMISAFTLAASNPSLPSSIKQCDEMGVSKKIYSFSLPLGATINMDGSCVSLIITALFMALIFGVPITGNIMLTLFIMIMVLSVGSPGVPGGNLVCMALLVPQIGVPAESISLVMGLYPIIGMMQVLANVTGDAVVTTIVAKSEKMLDLEKFNS